MFNIGSDEAVTIRKLAEEIISRVDSKVKIDYLPYRRAYGDDFEDVRRRVPDVTRLYDTIGPSRGCRLGAILDDIIRWKKAERQRRSAMSLGDRLVGTSARDDCRRREAGTTGGPPPKDLFPILDRTASLSPLFVLLTVLPGIIAFELASIDEVDAQWRLKSLEVSTVSSVLDAVDPSGSSPHPALKWQPPLGSWIAAVVRLALADR